MTADLNCVINLQLVFDKCYNVKYLKSPFHRLEFVSKTFGVMCSLYKSGKIVCIGAKSRFTAIKAIRSMARKVQKCDFPVRLTDLKIRNIAATYDFKSRIKLTDFYHFLGNRASYETEMFPGLIVNFNFNFKEKRKITIYPSGKCLIYGSTEENLLEECFQWFKKLYEDFKSAEQLRDFLKEDHEFVIEQNEGKDELQNWLISIFNY